VSFREAWEARESGELDGLDVVFIGREPLIRNKKATGWASKRLHARRLAFRTSATGAGVLVESMVMPD